MQYTKNYDRARLPVYLLFGAAMLFLRSVGANNEPLSLALLYAMCSAGLSPFWSGITFLLGSLIEVEWNTLFVSAAQAFLIAVAFFGQGKLRRNAEKGGWFLPMLALSVSLALFVVLAPFTPYALPAPIVLTAVYQKVVLSAVIFLLAAIFSVAVKALLKKVLRCRLRAEEIVFCVFFFVLVGVGICNFLGVNAYMGISFFVLLTFAWVVKDASALLCAFALALPPFLTVGLSVDAFFFYGVAVTLFVPSGRLGATLALITAYFGYGYFDGLFALAGEQLAQVMLSVVLPSLAFILLPPPIVRSLENKLVYYREKHLSRVAINRNRAAIGEQLYEISAVFREIQTTFAKLGTTEAEEGAREYVRGAVAAEVCRECPQYRSCQNESIQSELGKLVEVGCIKGRVSLIDIPVNLGSVCIDQSSILAAVNRHLVEYGRYMTETENAASGRALLASQAQGVSEILKNLAVEQSEPLRIYAEKERALSAAFSSVGIVCSEVLVSGEEDDPTLSLVSYGRAEVKKLAAVASRCLNAPMTISKRLSLNGDKYCCILRKKPNYDAAFGVATVQKAGESASGDTHAVIKLDERRFLVALCDGMGSGEYARRISESTISLLESFYRAKMPSEVILSTINKLLSFSREETFACVDIAVVDLDDGKADIVKIGSPVGFILSGNTVKVLETTSFPLGILSSLRPDTASYDLKENDCLVFLSDGITGAFGSTADLYEVIRTLPAGNPKALADALFERALAAYGGVAKDDMTALAVRLFKSKEAGL